jgi:hypothetical protein
MDKEPDDRSGRIRQVGLSIQVNESGRSQQRHRAGEDLKGPHPAGVLLQKSMGLQSLAVAFEPKKQKQTETEEKRDEQAQLFGAPERLKAFFPKAAGYQPAQLLPQSTYFASYFLIERFGIDDGLKGRTATGIELLPDLIGLRLHLPGSTHVREKNEGEQGGKKICQV